MTGRIRICTRIRWLIGAHVILAAGPVAGLGLFYSDLLPLMWVCDSLPLGGLLTLSVWVGLGAVRWPWRFLLGLVACFYVAIWSFVVDYLQITESMSTVEWITHYLEAVLMYSTLIVLFGGTFMLIGRRFKLTVVEPNEGPPPVERIQFSMFQILMLMSVVALILGLQRVTRGEIDDKGSFESTWREVAGAAFMLLIFFVNTACAVFATLKVGKVMRNIALVLIVSVLLGVALAIAIRQDMAGWWLFASSTVIVIIPTATVVASLLVVRSCGFRLIRRNGAES